ncbi:hypothetical protein CA54_49060 [Symmachiella macrocystis]|uniref:Uncharacterized protein n=1 Tax=Symmachiella macrocystis TaxID=2527985 RepID=A0A5C6BGU3_9PLAN|nr:hypothetical protein [Symmachiella macrocystis]TWU09664.1 hypothetical protein CA54_49060 [Symmachiella macrocystis]
MTQPTEAQLQANLQELAANMRQMSLNADEEAARCNAALASIHPENVTPVAFAELKNVTRDLSAIYVTSLVNLADNLEDLAASIGWDAQE